MTEPCELTDMGIKHARDKGKERVERLKIVNFFISEKDLCRKRIYSLKTMQITFSMNAS